jgi:hypothetical protein
MTDLMELASRVEAGEGPDKKLFEEAFVSCFGSVCPETRPSIAAAWIDRWRCFSQFINAGSWLDAAMMIVSERCGGEVRWQRRDNQSFPSARIWNDPDFQGTHHAIAATLSQALVAAALRARAHQGTAHVEQ